MDLVGRPPSAKQVATFAEDRNPDKRKRYVEGLLKTEEFDRHWAQTFADAWIPVEDQRRRPYREVTAWLQQAIHDRTPYDQIVQEVISARGRLDDSAAGAYVASALQNGSIERLTARTLDDFLGLEDYACAQCHDHPFDPDVRQEDFYGIAAYFAGARLHHLQEEGIRTLRVSDVLARGLRRDLGTAHGTHVIPPRYLDGREDIRRGENRRQALARLITSDVRFSMTAAQNLWSYLLGDKLKGQTTIALKILARDFSQNDYDLRRIIKIIALSSPYQRASRLGKGNTAAAPERLYARFSIRPLSPRVLFHSLIYVTSVDPKQPHLFSLRDTERQIRYNLRSFHDTLPDRSRDISTTTRRALFLLNGRLPNKASLATPGSVLFHLFQTHPDAKERLRALYETVLSRPPTRQETQRDLSYVSSAEHTKRAWEDVLYSMLISTEFLTNH